MPALPGETGLLSRKIIAVVPGKIGAHTFGIMRTADAPMKQLEDWDDFVATRYKEGKTEDEFRNYKADANPTVTEFYRQNHACQTYDFVVEKKAEYCGLNRGKKSIWEMADYLNTLVDDSDPDTDLTQIEHLLQTSEAIRKDDHPRWFVLTAFLHDLGKVLCLYGEPQWAVVGDTFPVGCAYSPEIVFPEFFTANPDNANSTFQIEVRRLQTRTAGSITCICRSGTTNTFMKSLANTFRRKASICSATTPSIRRTATARIAT